jgi:5,6,7,8-tetrahydromethanopterin hydro-lyase
MTADPAPRFGFAQSMLIGEAFVGEGPNAAHLNVVIGRKGGPVETAWATSLATPRAGHVPFLLTLRPGLPVQPMTLFVNKAEVRGDKHESLTWGAAQAGVAGGLAQAVREGLIPSADAPDLLVIAAVWVSWTADDEDAVFANNRAATHEAVAAAVTGRPTVDEVSAEAAHPWNAYYHRHRN